MFAVVTELQTPNSDKRIEVGRVGDLWHIAVGKRVSRRRLKSILRDLDGRFIFSTSINTRGLIPFSTDKLKRNVLFRQFADHVLRASGIGLSVGIVDRDGILLETDTTTQMIAHAESVTVCTLRPDIDGLCREWLLLTGICPEVTADPRHLLNCDCVFSPDLRAATVGLLFGKGGIKIDRGKIDLPEVYLPLIRAGVDPVDLKCIISEPIRATMT